MGPTVILIWVWNWVACIPKTIAEIYSGLKCGDLLDRFTFLDAMTQFIVAVATSCHPQDDGGMYTDFSDDEGSVEKNKETYSKQNTDGIVFGGAGQTLRSRTAEKESS